MIHRSSERIAAHLRPVGQRHLRHAQRGRVRRWQQVTLRRVRLLLLRPLLLRLLLLLMQLVLLLLRLLLRRDADGTVPSLKVGILLRRRRLRAPVKLRVRSRRGRRGWQQPLPHVQTCSRSVASCPCEAPQIRHEPAAQSMCAPPCSRPTWHIACVDVDATAVTGSTAMAMGLCQPGALCRHDCGAEGGRRQDEPCASYTCSTAASAHAARPLKDQCIAAEYNLVCMLTMHR